jgi:hypothetical protein
MFLKNVSLKIIFFFSGFLLDHLQHIGSLLVHANHPQTISAVIVVHYLVNVGR